MHFLPKANPLYENVPASKVTLPDVLEKLGKGGFTGYLSYTTATFESYCLYAKGNLICAFSSDGDRDKTGFEAISTLFENVVSGGGVINVYRMTSDLSMCSHALIVGTKLISDDEVRQVDIKAVLARMKNQNLSGAVHFYTADQYAMMFYKNGQPIGFYHNKSKDIESSPDESRRIAALPGARVNICVTKPLEELLNYNLLQMVNLDKLWTSAQNRVSANQDKPATVAAPATIVQTADTSKLEELVEDLKEIASAYLSKEGKELVEKQVTAAGGVIFLLDSQRVETFLKQVEDGAVAVDRDARIGEMIDLMKSEIAGRLAV